MSVVIINCGLGNLASVKNMIKKVGGSSVISSDHEEINATEKLVLPGVGHFKKGMENLKESGLYEVVNKKVVEDKTPILGICLGMQLMTSHSEEGDVDGFGWIDAQTTKFSFDDPSVKVPNIGWNEINYAKDSVFNTDEQQRYYFVHSYKVSCNNQSDVLATANYGGLDYVCAFQKENIVGMQYHPEKSHRFGMEVFKKFLAL